MKLEEHHLWHARSTTNYTKFEICIVQQVHVNPVCETLDKFAEKDFCLNLDLV